MRPKQLAQKPVQQQQLQQPALLGGVERQRGRNATETHTEADLVELQYA